MVVEIRLLWVVVLAQLCVKVCSVKAKASFCLEGLLLSLVSLEGSPWRHRLAFVAAHMTCILQN